MEMCIDYNYSSMYVWIIVRLNLQFQKCATQSDTMHVPSIWAFTVHHCTHHHRLVVVCTVNAHIEETYNVWLIKSSGISRTSRLLTYSLNFIARQDIRSKCSKCLKIEYWTLAGRGFKFCRNSVKSEKLRNSCNIARSGETMFILKG